MNRVPQVNKGQRERQGKRVLQVLKGRKVPQVKKVLEVKMELRAHRV